MGNKSSCHANRNITDENNNKSITDENKNNNKRSSLHQEVQSKLTSKELKSSIEDLYFSTWTKVAQNMFVKRGVQSYAQLQNQTNNV